MIVPWTQRIIYKNVGFLFWGVSNKYTLGEAQASQNVTCFCVLYRLTRECRTKLRNTSYVNSITESEYQSSNWHILGYKKIVRKLYNPFDTQNKCKQIIGCLDGKIRHFEVIRSDALHCILSQWPFCKNLSKNYEIVFFNKINENTTFNHLIYLSNLLVHTTYCFEIKVTSTQIQSYFLLHNFF